MRRRRGRPEPPPSPGSHHQQNTRTVARTYPARVDKSIDAAESAVHDHAGTARIVHSVREAQDAALSARADLHRVTLVYGNRHASDIALHDEVRRLGATRPNLSVELLLTRPAEDWTSLRGRIDADFLAA